MSVYREQVSNKCSSFLCRIYTKYTIYTIGGGGVEREMDGWMVYCLISGLTITILWVNDMYT